jgi:microcystin-dependent protein
MSSPFVAEIRIWAINFAPTGWAFCNGQLLSISQNTALFSLLGTNYGGNGQSTFGQPDFQGSAALNEGQSNTGSQYFIGQIGGTETVTLLVSEMPLHTHTLQDHDLDLGELNTPAPNRVLAQSANSSIYTPAANLNQMNFQGLPPAGSSLPHNNMMPYLALNFCIAMQGVFPPRT